MSTVPSADAKAVVRAIEGLTTQVRRAVDALTTTAAQGVVGAATAKQTDFALAPTPPDDGPRCVCGDPIEPWTGPGEPGWIHSPGSDTPCTDARPACDMRGPWGNAHACVRPRGHTEGHEALDGCEWEQAPAAAEDAQRTERRHSIRVLLNRLNNGLPLGSDEAQLLTRHVAAEICDANDGRKEAQRLGLMVDEYSEGAVQLGEKLIAAREETATADRIRAEVQRDRDQHAAVLNEVLRSFRHETHPGRRCLQSEHVPVEEVERWRSVVAPTTERPWWVDVAEVRTELEQAQAAIERVRALVVGTAKTTSAGISDHHIGRYDLAVEVLAALDGTEQPTTEPEPLRVEPCKPPRMAVHCGGECLAITDSDPDRDRIDRIALLGDTLTVFTGTLGGPPPTCGPGAQLIAEVEVLRGTTTITAAHITSSGLLFYRPTTEPS